MAVKRQIRTVLHEMLQCEAKFSQSCFMQAFILLKKAFQISYVLRDMPEYKPISKSFPSLFKHH